MATAPTPTEPSGPPLVRHVPAPPRADIQVTVSLAQAGFLFSMARDAEGEVIWTVPFESPFPSPLAIELQQQGRWLVILCVPGIGSPTPELTKLMLTLNGQTARGRCGFDNKGNILVVSDLLRAAVAPDNLGDAIYSVMTTAEELRRAHAQSSVSSASAPDPNS